MNPQPVGNSRGGRGRSGGRGATNGRNVAAQGASGGHGSGTGQGQVGAPGQRGGSSQGQVVGSSQGQGVGSSQRQAAGSSQGQGVGSSQGQAAGSSQGQVGGSGQAYAGGIRRRRVDAENGDRYCPNCGQVIFGQAREMITRCPYRNCGAGLPYAEGREFQNAWGRCAGSNCMNYIENVMNYCTLCGTINPTAFERRDRLERARRQQEEFRLRARIRELEEAEARRNEEIRGMREIIQNQENEIFLNQLPLNVEEMLLDDADLENADAPSQDAAPAEGGEAPSGSGDRPAA